MPRNSDSSSSSSCGCCSSSRDSHRQEYSVEEEDEDEGHRAVIGWNDVITMVRGWRLPFHRSVSFPPASHTLPELLELSEWERESNCLGPGRLP